MNAREAAVAAGWIPSWLGDVWYTTDADGVMALGKPVVWRGTAKDLCLAQGIPHND